MQLSDAGFSGLSSRFRSALIMSYQLTGTIIAAREKWPIDTFGARPERP